MNLNRYGWNQEFERHFANYREQGYSAGRVVAEYKHYYKIVTAEGEWLGEISGKMRHDALSRTELPAVGDWVVLRQYGGHALIHAILPRKSKFSRNVAGDVTEEQIVATNIDTVFMMNALNQDFNLRRLERYLLLTWESGATPVVVLSKADLCESIEDKIAEVRSVAFDIPIHTISVKQGTGLEALNAYLEEGKTVALLGSSGVGKSSLINALAGQELQRVNEIRAEDGRGKHTTTHRELLVLPSGAIIIDTPGMRELQLQASDDSFRHTFQDIEELAEQCHYRDCKHQGEPGCAIAKAIADGELEIKRYQNYMKLQRELARIARKEQEKEKKHARLQYRHPKKR